MFHLVLNLLVMLKTHEVETTLVFRFDWTSICTTVKIGICSCRNTNWFLEYKFQEYKLVSLYHYKFQSEKGFVESLEKHFVF